MNNSSDSLGRTITLERITAISNADCFHSPLAFEDVQADVYCLLRESIPWEQGSVKVYGSTWAERRLTCLFSDNPGETYHYSGKEMVAKEWDPVVDAIRNRLYRICNAYYPEWEDNWRFDTCLCNYYRPKAEIPVEEGAEWKPDIISFHSDSEEDLIVDRPIASVSFGATRRFDLRANTESRGKHIKAPVQHEDVQTYLGSGSLFIMGRNTQRYYKHQVPAEKKVMDGRINLTFRMTKLGE